MELVLPVWLRVQNDSLECAILKEDTDRVVSQSRLVAEHAQHFLLQYMGKTLVSVSRTIVINALSKLVVHAPLIRRHVVVRQDVAVRDQQGLVVQKDLLVGVKNLLVLLVSEE